MASKRMRNRVYWAHVKAQTYHPGTLVARDLRDAFHCLDTDSDRAILAMVEDRLLDIEAEHGPAGLRNVHNRDLWPVRERIAMATRP